MQLWHVGRASIPGDSFFTILQSHTHYDSICHKAAKHCMLSQLAKSNGCCGLQHANPCILASCTLHAQNPCVHLLHWALARWSNTIVPMYIRSKLWCCDAELQPEGRSPIGPSAVAIPTDNSNLCPHPETGKMVPYAVPRALETSEIPGVVQQFADGARNAIKAGSQDFQSWLPYGFLSNVGSRYCTIFQIIMQMLAQTGINNIQQSIILYTTRLQIICACQLEKSQGSIDWQKVPWILVEKK